MLDDLATATNSAFVWSSGMLTLVPYGDAALDGNGYAYTPPSSPLYDLADDDYMPNTYATGSSATVNDDAVLLTRIRSSDASTSGNRGARPCEPLQHRNHHRERSGDNRDLRPARIAEYAQLHMFCDLNAARVSARCNCSGRRCATPTSSRSTSATCTRPDGHRDIDRPAWDSTPVGAHHRDHRERRLLAVVLRRGISRRHRQRAALQFPERAGVRGELQRRPVRRQCAGHLRADGGAGRGPLGLAGGFRRAALGRLRRLCQQRRQQLPQCRHHHRGPRHRPAYGGVACRPRSRDRRDDRCDPYAFRRSVAERRAIAFRFAGRRARACDAVLC